MPMKMVVQDKWSLMTRATQDGFDCSYLIEIEYVLYIEK